MFVLLFIRHVLDHCSNVDEVARYAETVALYDSDLNTISHHFVIMDASGHWLVIDYPDGNMRLKRGRNESQVRTNHFLEGGPAIDNTSFRRYDILEQALFTEKSITSEFEAMKLLKQVRHDTQWSVVYNPKSKTGLLAVWENYSTQYKFGW
jgi:penicillin V acylase-like amidase (Ntn superfamily)